MIWQYTKNMLAGAADVVKKGFMHIFAGNVLVKLMAFFSSMIVIRMVDKIEYANFAYANNLYSYIGLLSGMGMAAVLIRYCSKDVSKEKDKAYLYYSMKVGGLFELSMVALLCVFVCVFPLPFPRARYYTLILSFTQILSLIVVLLQSYNRAHLDFKAHARIGVLQSVTVCAFTIAFVSLWGVTGSVIARYIALLITLGYCVYCCKDKYPRGVKPYVMQPAQKKEFFVMGITLMMSNFFSSVMPINENFLINNIIHDEISTANFRVAGLLPEQLLLISGAITVYFFPIFSRMTNGKEVMRKALKVGTGTAGLVFFAALGGILLTPIFIRVAYGTKYSDAVGISYMLWIMRALNAGFRVVPLNVLSAVGHYKFNAMLSGVACVLHVIIDYFFIKYMGITGVAYATAVIYLLTGGIAWAYLFYVCRKNKIRSVME